MKSPRIPRLARKTALVCVALSAVLCVVLAFAARARAAVRLEPSRAHLLAARDLTPRSDPARAKYPTQPLVLREDQHTILAFPPRSSKKSLTVVYLHGIHGRAENGCPWLRAGASELGWLVCPEANERLPNDTFSWSGTVFEQRAVVARAEHAAHSQGADPASPGVMVGFSQGAFVALDLVRAGLGRYRGLVLIGASVEPLPAVLAAGGIERIVLAAGDLDGAAGPMKAAAERLRAGGIDVRFVSLGRIGHSYETTDREALRAAIAWAGGAA